jgi:predicted nucleic acid-binding protein
VDIFFDTTVLVAASEQSHPHYAQARPVLLRVAAGHDVGFMSQHSIAEVFALASGATQCVRRKPI